MASAAARAREGTPAPVIGRAGRYTVFMTPPPTPMNPSGSPRPEGPGSKPAPSTVPLHSSSPSPKTAAVPPPAAKARPSPPPPPVQVPPRQFGKPSSGSSNSVLGVFWGAVAKVQDAHSSLDEYLADWLGLNQSKYQWALNDYYEKKGTDKETGQTKDPASKTQTV